MRISLPFTLFLLSIALSTPPCRAAGESCGDPPFDDCGSGEFCARLGGLCVAPYPYGVCLRIPEICTAHWDPVCGCDFQTYSNSCFARMAGVSVADTGSCLQDCAPGFPCDDGQVCYRPGGQCSTSGICLSPLQDCPDTCSLVCGCDDKTYRNSCLAYLEGVAIDHFGECGHPEQPTIEGVVARGDGVLTWQEHPDALAYHVYREVVTDGSPSGATYCYVPNLLQPELHPGDAPQSGDLWLLLVSGQFASGEGPLGIGDDCTPRHAVENCD